MTNKLKKFTARQRDILFILGAEGPAHQDEIHTRLQDYHDETIRRSIVYTSLDTFRSLGLAERQPGSEGTGNYKITDEGVATLEERTRWELAALRKAGADSEHLVVRAEQDN